MVNRVVLVGRMTQDPEVRKTQSGVSVCSFTVAVNRRFNRDQTDFIRCVAWRQTADFMGQYLNKGALISVEGSIQSGSYEDRETGKKIYTMDVQADNVQALESRSARQGTQASANPGSYRSQATVQQPQMDEPDDGEPILDIASDDLPF